jgi:hypothetical protein
MKFDRLMYVDVKLATEGFQWEKTEPIWARGPVGRPRSVVDWPHFGPKNSGISPKIPS